MLLFCVLTARTPIAWSKFSGFQRRSLLGFQNGWVRTATIGATLEKTEQLVKKFSLDYWILAFVSPLYRQCGHATRSNFIRVLVSDFAKRHTSPCDYSRFETASSPLYFVPLTSAHSSAKPIYGLQVPSSTRIRYLHPFYIHCNA